MTFINQKERFCEECKHDIKIGQNVYLKNDKNIVCIKCIYLIDKLNRPVNN